MPVAPNWIPVREKRYSATVNINFASVAAATIAKQTLTSSTYPRLKGLKAQVPTFIQFKLAPEFADIHILGCQAVANGTAVDLVVTLQNSNAVSARDLAAADFLIWQE